MTSNSMQYPDSEKHGFEPNQDEPTIDAFLKDQKSLEQYLGQFEHEGIQFTTYPKLRESFAEIWTHYISQLSNLFGFSFERENFVLDVGAHQGFFAVNCAVRNQDIKVVAVEPNPINLAVLSKNLSHAGVSNVEIISAAAGAKDGEAVFNFGKTSTTGALHTSARDWKRTQLDIAVRVVSLPSLLEKSPSRTVKLLKCDCEGGEYDFLMNAPKETLQRVEYLALEVHPTLSHKPIELETFLRNLGWETHHLPGAMGSALQGCTDLFAKNLRFS
jgi:FkbM family methyltransferase